MWHIAIPAICVLAHVYLVILFLPGFWREMDQRGFRWHYAVSLFVVPLLVIVLTGSHLLREWSSLPDWHRVVGFITIDALLVAVVLAAVGLARRRRRAA